MEPDPVYRFQKVEEYFKDHLSWKRLGNVISDEYYKDSAEPHTTLTTHTRTLSLIVEGGYQDKECCLLIEILTPSTFRVRFRPDKRSPSEYTVRNTRAVVGNTIEKFKEAFGNFPIDYSSSKTSDTIDIVTSVTSTEAICKISVNKKPFSIQVSRFDDKHPYDVWSTNKEVGLCWAENDYQPDGGPATNFSIIQAVEKPPAAKYTGFGENGGIYLFKNSYQLTSFNFDNYVYNQIYGGDGRGPLDNREPLYHSDPFFIEFNGIPGKKSVNAIFVDNYSQICFDIGYTSSNRYMFGTRFGDLDYYIFFGDAYRDIIRDFTSLVGRCRLKPRFILGYHQGCYGWQNSQDVMDVCNGYRGNRIPIDGFHIDVDAQRNYKTFTLNENFPKELFAKLRDNGIKCCTNITPIISKDNSEGYSTYQTAISEKYFILDERISSSTPDSLQQYYEGGEEIVRNTAMDDRTPGDPFIGEVDYGNGRGVKGHYPDFGRPEVRKWWGKQYQDLFSLGLEFIWQDMTTPAIRSNRGDMKGFPFRLLVTENSLSGKSNEKSYEKSPALKVWNLYSYNLHKATYHGINHLLGRENMRTFIIGRGSYTGSHRYCGLWTGDNASDWDFLEINVAQVLALGLSGLSIVGADIGGFGQAKDKGSWAGPELLIRWTTVGSFLPWFRNHYVKHGQKIFQEPYKYQDYQDHGFTELEKLHYRAVLPVTKHYIELRYRLMQLWYDGMWENVLTGLPICRALFINDPQDPALFNDKLRFNSSQFFVGKDLLVAPITRPGVSKRDVYLPYGHDWYCFMDNKLPLRPPVKGGSTYKKFDARIDTEPGHLGFHVPVFVRAGAIIPEIPLEQWVGELHKYGKPCNITLNIYPGESGEYTMHLDDGISRSSARDRFDEKDKAKDENREVMITHRKSESNVRVINISRTVDNYTPPIEKFYRVALLHDWSGPRPDPLEFIHVGDVNIGGSDKNAVLSDDNVHPVNAWWYDEPKNIITIKVIDDKKDINIEVKYRKSI